MSGVLPVVRIVRLDGLRWSRFRDIRLRALRDAPDAFWATAEDEAAMPAAQWRERLDRVGTVTVVAAVEGADAGLIVGAPHHGDPDDAGLYAMWVAPEARGRGVGDARGDRTPATPA